MFSRNFGGIAWAATIAVALHRLAPAGGQLHHRADRVLGFRGDPHRPHSRRRGERQPRRAAFRRGFAPTGTSVRPRTSSATLPRSVFSTNPIKKDEKGKTHDSLPLEASPRRGRERKAADARPRGGARSLAAARADRRARLGLAACGGSDSDASGERKRRRHDRPGRLLDPAGAPNEESSSPGSTGRPTARASSSRTRSAPRATSRGRSRPACRLTSSTSPLEPDMTRLVDAGLVADDWATRTPSTTASSRTRSSSSPSARATPRASSPGTTWSSGDIEVITPNPFTSGGARWNLMAAYGSQIEQGKSEEEALQYVQSCSSTPRSRTRAPATRWRRSSAARATCSSPTRTRRSPRSDAGEELEYIVPDQTILIETPAAVTTEADDAGARRSSITCISDEGQQLWADRGYRPVDRGGARRERGQVPDARRTCSRSTTSAAGTRSRPSSSTRRAVRSRRSSANLGVATE